MRDDKILIVEDEQIIAIDLSRRLERFGYNVVGSAVSGEEAIKLAKKHSPDIILMDIMLSGHIDGIEAASIIKDELSIPVIFLTAYSDQGTIQRAKTAEPSGYIIKPFKDKELYTTIDISLYKYRINHKIKLQQCRLATILNSVQDGIIATDTDNRIILINPAAQKLLGWAEENAIGKILSDIVCLEDMNDPLHSQVELPSEKDLIRPHRQFTFKNCYLINRFGETLQVEGSFSAIIEKKDMVDGFVLVIRDMTTISTLSDAIEYHTSHDKLTGLFSRQQFSVQIENIIKEKSFLNDGIKALVYIDIDRFKIINKTCNYQKADSMLIKIAQIVTDFTAGQEYRARLGSDQFGLIINEKTKKEVLEKVKNLHDTIYNNKLEWEDRIFSFDTSMGITFIEANSVNVSDILAEAQDACLVAKDEGGNRIKIYDKKDRQFQKRSGEIEWVSKLSKAIDQNRFQIFIQEIRPVDKIKTSYSKGEILIRMLDEDGNYIMPADFIPAAERYNMMSKIDKWVISNAIMLFQKNREMGRLSNIKEISLNLSAQSISNDSILDFIKNEFKLSGIPPEEICFEITETTTISNMASAHEFIDALRRTGCTFALDDFGSGFSSFNYLKNLPVDYLKIDGIFVKNMHEDDENRAMVEAINNMGHIMGKKTIAEFVCNEKIITMLRDLGVDFAQGYEISKPIPLMPVNKYA